MTGTLNAIPLDNITSLETTEESPGFSAHDVSGPFEAVAEIGADPSTERSGIHYARIPGDPGLDRSLFRGHSHGIRDHDRGEKTLNDCE